VEVDFWWVWGIAMTIRIHANSLTLGSFDKINEWVEQIRENIV